MKRILPLICFTALAGAASTPALLAVSLNPPEFVEHQAYELVEGEWSEMEIGDVTNCARVWCLETEPMEETLGCQMEHTVAFKLEASVAQWSEIEMLCDGFHWGVRTPGTYVAGPIGFYVRANHDIELTFDGFENLKAIDPDMTIDTMIEVKYALTGMARPPDPDDDLWMAPEELNELSLLIEDSYLLHWLGWTTNIYSSISTSPCNGPTDWVDENWAVITASITDQQEWIDDETGYFDGMPDFPFQ